MNPNDLRDLERRSVCAAAAAALQDAARRHSRPLAAALAARGRAVGEQTPFRQLVRAARSLSPAPPELRQFETMVRPALLAYLKVCGASRLAPAAPEARFLIDHFDQYTKVPVTGSRIHRMLIWCRRTLRAAREALRT